MNCNQYAAYVDEEGTLNNAGSLNGFVESYLQIDESLITRELLRCKKIYTNSINALKQDVESLTMLLQAVYFECS